MPPDNLQIETLKFVLENVHQPHKLDDHPWAQSLVARESSVQGTSPGQQLVVSIGRLFAQMIPSIPPRQGKRLDTRWGEFGLLAAQYFAPLSFGTPLPANLRDAWGRIDESILLFVYGRPGDALSESQKEAYKLVGDELEIAPYSTLSDWHRKGLQRLMEMLLAREDYLARSLSQPAVISTDGRELARKGTSSQPMDTQGIDLNRRVSKRRRYFLLSILVLLLLSLLLAGGLEARKIYNLAIVVRQDLEQLQDLASAPEESRLERVRAAGPVLTTLRQDFLALKSETQPYLWLGPWLAWVPQYGGELASIQDLVTLADASLASAEISYQAFSPLLKEDALSGLTPASLTEHLKRVQPQLLEAQREVERASAARKNINIENLSPQVRDLLLDKVDPAVSLLQEGLSLAVQLPRLMGATSEGPKTYLLLAQNEDELRPTGGFITAAGTVLVQNGRIGEMNFKNSGDLEDWTKPYPAAPWQLKEYMNSQVLILRDTTWFADYPTSAWYAENMYSYISGHSVDGVIAFNQQLLVKLLRFTGPVNMEGEPNPVDADNVIAYMRAAKTPTAEESASPDWNNKLFMNKISNALLEKISSGDIEWEKLATTLPEALNERDLLVQVDNPEVTAFLARHGWDGTVQPGNADFLMVADSNIGFNKTNAVVQTSLVYDVDLTDLLTPVASLSVEHKNNAAEMFTCHHWDKIRAEGEQGYPITDCYWDYMRVYRPEDTELLDSEPQFIPANWMWNYRSVEPKVDVLDDEEIDGVQAFGTLIIVPGGQSVMTGFYFDLPPTVLALEQDSGRVVYHLRVQKQPGTLAVPLTIRVHLAPGSTVYQSPSGSVVDGSTVSFQTGLRTDLEFEIIFAAP